MLGFLYFSKKLHAGKRGHAFTQKLAAVCSVAQLRRRISRIFCTHAPRNLPQIRLSSLTDNDGVAENKSTSLCQMSLYPAYEAHQQ